MSDIHVTYQWVRSAEGDSAELVRKEAVIGAHTPGGVVHLDDLEDLSHFDVRELRIADNQLRDLKPLAKIQGLEVLHLTGNQIVNVTPLAGLEQLKVLDLGRNPRLESIAPLASLHKLEELSLYETGVYDIEPIAHLPSLRKLNISNARVSDLAPLTMMRRLREIQLFGFGEVERGTDDWNILVDLLVRGVRVDAHGIGKMMTAARHLREQRKNNRS
jgi:hypothetical protein